MGLLHQVRRRIAKPFALPVHTDAMELLRLAAGAQARQLALSLGGYDDLSRLAARYKSDKGVTVFPFHGYTVHYAKLFEPLRARPIKVLEIGLARLTERAELGMACPSLSMWLDYFPHATITGFDIDDFSSVRLPRARIVRGDQGVPADLLQVVTPGAPYDIIIDDGSHASYHQQVTLKTLFPHLAPNGMFAIEDLAWQPQDLEASLPAVPRTTDLLKDSAALAGLVGGGVKSVQFFESPVQRGKEGLAVIVKA